MKTFESIELFITSFSEKGYGVGYLNPEVKSSGKVEVAHTIPGDKVQINLQRKRKGVKKGKLLTLLEPSKERVQPRCPHVGLCGGCTWQQMDYTTQLRYKEQIVTQSFKPFLDGVEVSPIIASHDPWQYRNKMEFTFSENAAKTRFLGLMIAHAASYVFNLQTCFLAKPWVTNVLNIVRTWWEESGLPSYRLESNSGILRHLTLREGTKTGEKMVILTVSGNPQFPFEQTFQDSFLKAVLSLFPDEEHPQINVVIRTQTIATGVPTSISERAIFGKDHIRERLDIFPGENSLFFDIGPSSFFQPNTLQAEIFYRTGIEMLELSTSSLVYDLYSGTGTLGMCMAKRAQKVVGIELIGQAVENARENSRLNGISNFEVHQGDVGKVLTKLLTDASYRSPDAVIVDPPRAGLDPLAIEHIKTLRAKKILYISCNPRTQAENIGELIRFGYQLKRLQPVDQFPHTAHVENLAVLTL